jgi:hypothetical protein
MSGKLTENDTDFLCPTTSWFILPALLGGVESVAHSYHVPSSITKHYRGLQLDMIVNPFSESLPLARNKCYHGYLLQQWARSLDY